MEVWVGLVHVKPRRGNDVLEDAIGAFVPAVGLAENGNDFASAVFSLLDKYEFDVAEMKEVETLQQRELRACLDSKISELVGNLSSENPVELGSFHTYMQEESQKGTA